MDKQMETRHMLVATLGGQPQIVTFTLDLLLRRGIPISEVIVVHPASSPAIQPALLRLRNEFIDDETYLFEGQERPIRFSSHLIRSHGVVVEDIVDGPCAEGALNTIGALIRSLKRAEATVYFSISGGRRLMSFLSFSAAALYFQSEDEVIHLYTPAEVQNSALHEQLMHLPPSCGQELIFVPFARAAQPLLAAILDRSSTALIEESAEKQREESRTNDLRCEQVYKKLSDRQRQVLRKLARGHNPEQLALLLYITRETVSSHTKVIYSECRIAWDLPLDEKLDYRDVRSLFAGYHFPFE
jgi:CRISPR-associated protein Csx14